MTKLTDPADWNARFAAMAEHDIEQQAKDMAEAAWLMLRLSEQMLTSARQLMRAAETLGWDGDLQATASMCAQSETEHAAERPGNAAQQPADGPAAD